jgi:hypothetical protein
MNDADEQRAIQRQLAKIQHKREYLRNHTEALVNNFCVLLEFNAKY